MDEDKVIKMLLKHDEGIEYIKENMTTKKDLGEISNTLDKLVKLAEKKDEELAAGAHNAKRLTDRVEVLEKDMKYVKPALGLA